MAYGRAARSCLGWVAVATVVACAGCGSDANLGINSTPQCGGGAGTQIRGVVRMPNGRLAAGPSGVAERLAALAVAPVDALTGTVSPVGRGVTVELVQLRPEDVASGSRPGAIAHATTNGKGEFCVALARDTNVDVCRYMLRVGSAGTGTLTRAFVYSTDAPTDIDYASEATVQVILQGIPPGDLCEYSPAEIGAIHEAVRAVPGSVGGGSAAEVNALATTKAAADATVRALVREAGNLPPPTATNVPGSTATPTAQSTVAPSRTATHAGPTDPPTARPTRTPNGPSATPTTTRTAGATRTPTLGGATATATRPGATATATRAAATATATVPAATATAIATATRPAATATATVPPPTSTVGVTATYTATATPGVELGERVFTIREDSQFPGDDPRTGFFSSALSGKSISDKFSAGPLVFVAGAPDAQGIATLRLKQDAYFKINVPAGATVLCLRLLAAGSSGRIDCDGGTPFAVSLTEAAGANAPKGTPRTGQGGDSGPGAAEFSVMQSIAELTNFNAACDATVTFPAPSVSVYTTATFTAMKGTRTLAKTGESFDCATWTMTDGPGMWVNGVVAYESRAGGDSASATRLADR